MRGGIEEQRPPKAHKRPDRGWADSLMLLVVSCSSSLTASSDAKGPLHSELHASNAVMRSETCDSGSELDVCTLYTSRILAKLSRTSLAPLRMLDVDPSCKEASGTDPREGPETSDARYH